MTYELTDTNDALIKIGPTISGDQVSVQIRDIGISAGYIRNEDAPTVALAILEAAGNVDINSLEAISRLREYVRLRKAKSGREAEDAKVRAWWDETRYGHTTSLCWGHMGESAHEDVRKQYRLARKFFEES